VTFLNPLYHAVAFLLVGIHTGLGHVFGFNNGWGWALSIVLLTVGMRLVLFPIFVRQIKTQRAMQAIQPRMKELQTKYKNDKERLNQEMMALWKENGANPLSGCAPMLLQIPIFISLFHTLRAIKPVNKTCNTHMESCFSTKVPGFSQHDIFSAAHAKIFSVPISVSFSSGKTLIDALGGTLTATRVLAIGLTILMSATTFITQRQLMARNAADGTSQMAQQQKILLYVFPLLFLFYGFKFPIGVLLYWLTTNVWSMGQQRIVISRMNTAPAEGGPAASGPAVGAKPKQPTRGGPKATADDAPAPPAGPAPGAKPKPAGGGGSVVLPPGGAIPRSTPPRPAGSSSGNSNGARRPQQGRSNKRKRGRR
jgi:YidC/Oxa1 family membrane protein insertase